MLYTAPGDLDNTSTVLAQRIGETGAPMDRSGNRIIVMVSEATTRCIQDLGVVSTHAPVPQRAPDAYIDRLLDTEQWKTQCAHEANAGNAVALRIRVTKDASNTRWTFALSLFFFVVLALLAVWSFCQSFQRPETWFPCETPAREDHPTENRP